MLVNLNFFHKMNCPNIWNDKLLTSQSGLRVSFFFPPPLLKIKSRDARQTLYQLHPHLTFLFHSDLIHKGMCECVDKGTQNSKDVYTASCNASIHSPQLHMHYIPLKERYKLVQTPRLRTTLAVTHLTLTCLVIL